MFNTNDNIDNIACGIFVSLVFISVLNDSCSILNNFISSPTLKKKCNYFKKISNIIFNIGKNNYKSDKDGNIIIEEELEKQDLEKKKSLNPFDSDSDSDELDDFETNSKNIVKNKDFIEEDEIEEEIEDEIKDEIEDEIKDEIEEDEIEEEIINESICIQNNLEENKLKLEITENKKKIILEKEISLDKNQIKKNITKKIKKGDQLVIQEEQCVEKQLIIEEEQSENKLPMKEKQNVKEQLVIEEKQNIEQELIIKEEQSEKHLPIKEKQNVKEQLVIEEKQQLTKKKKYEEKKPIIEEKLNFVEEKQVYEENYNNLEKINIYKTEKKINKRKTKKIKDIEEESDKFIEDEKDIKNIIKVNKKKNSKK